MCDEAFICNPSNCECECDKSCDIGNIAYENETLDAIPLNAIPLNVYKKVYNSCKIYIVLFVAFLMTSICICCVFVYLYWYLKKDNINTHFSVRYLNI